MDSGTRARRHLSFALCVAGVLLAAGCGDSTSAVSPSAPVAVYEAAIPSPELNVEVEGTTARVSWATPEGLLEPLLAFDVYVDRQKPRRLDPKQAEIVLDHLEGGQHLVQVVALTETRQSLPAARPFVLPFPERPQAVAAASSLAAVASPQGGVDKSDTSAQGAATPNFAAAPQAPVEEPSGSAQLTTRGTLLLGNESMNGYWDGTRFVPNTGDCAPRQSGYEDIRNGAQVVLTDATGATVGVGALANGRLTQTRQIQRGGPDDGNLPVHTQTWGLCMWDFSVTYTSGSPFYGVQVSRRGVVQHAAADLAANKVALSIGDK